MLPIHELLARIRFDPEFGRGCFELGYEDHTARALVRIPMGAVRAPPDYRFGIEVIDDDGAARSIPYHRIRAVWRDGELIWSRPS